VYKKIFISVIGLLFVAGMLTGGCSDNAMTTATKTPSIAGPQYDGILRIGTQTIPKNNIGWPTEASQVSESDMVFLTCNRLLSTDSKGTPLPELAKSWKIADDGKSITFSLRDDVKFHDGSQFDAAAAKWNMDYWLGAHMPGLDRITSIEVVDTCTLKVNITEYINTILVNLASFRFGFVSPAAFKKNGLEWMRNNPVGTGPFKLVSWKPEVSSRFVRFDDYWGGRPYLDEIRYTYLPDAMTGLLMMLHGELDVFMESDVTAQSGLQQKGFAVAPPMTGGGMAILCPSAADLSSPFADRRVREALEYAIDKESLVWLGLGNWQPLYQFATRNSIGYNSEITARKYDPIKAKQLLAEAGYPDGIKTKYNVTVGAIPQDVAIAVQRYLNEAGFKCTMKSLTFAAGTDMMFHGWDGIFFCGVNPDMDYLQRAERYVSANSVMYPSILRPAALQPLVDEALTARASEGKTAAAKQIVKFVYDQSLIIPLYETGGEQIIATYVQDSGFGVRGQTFWDPAKCWIKTNK